MIVGYRETTFKNAQVHNNKKIFMLIRRASLHVYSFWKELLPRTKELKKRE